MPHTSDNLAITPEIFLENVLDMPMKNISLIVFIDDCQRQPSLSYIMERYAEFKIQEHKKNEII